MKYYCIFTDQSGLNGIPIFLEARLWEKIPADPMTPVSKEYNYEWATLKYEKVRFPKELYFIVKAPKISFDYYWFRCGFVCSEEFKSIVEKYNNEFESVPLIVSSNKLKDIATKNYHLLKFYSYLDAIDYDKSSFETLKKEDGTVESVNGVPWITKFEKLVLKEDVITGKDLFCLNSAIFGRNLFCSENFKSVAEKMKMYGLLFIPYEEAADFINFNGFLGPATYDRHKSFQQKK